MRNYRLVIALFGVLLAACGGRAPALNKQNAKLQEELAELRSEARKERTRLADLEKRLALRQAERSVEEQSTAPAQAAERPELPVEVRAPQTLGSEYELPEDYEIMGVDSEGVEIIYVGEAASDKVIKIPPRSFEVDDEDDDAGYDYDDRPAARPSLRTARVATASRPAPSDLPPVPTVSDRLSVTDSVPTIDSQMRQARVAVPRTRARGLGDPRAEYRRYYEALRAGNHSYAVTGFRNFVERFPGHDFADNAQYWLGEAFYDQKRYKSALLEFRKVIDNHPQGNKVPDALLKLGYCYSQLDEAPKAKQVWEQIIRVYPRSNPAALAATKLSELKD